MSKSSAKIKKKTTPKIKKKESPRYTPSGDIRSSKWSEEWQRMIDAAGGSSALLALEWGCSHTTIHRWREEQSSPNKLERLAIQQWCATRGLLPPRWD